MKKYLLFTLAWLNTASGYACVCLDRTFEESFLEATLILYANVVSVDTVTFHRYVDVPGEDGKQKVLFREVAVRADVKKFYKGKSYVSRLLFFTGISSAECGVSFTPGKDYILYLDTKPSPELTEKDGISRETPMLFFQATLCNRTTDDVKSELELFKKHNKKPLRNKPVTHRFSYR